MSKKQYTDKQFTEAVKNSGSIRQVLLKLNLAPKGGNYVTVHKNVKRLNLDTSHFHGQVWNKGQNFVPKRPLSDYTSNKHSIKSHSLKIRLIKEEIFIHKCYKCQRTEWNGKPISIELEHIDGNHDNNNLDNLTLLCPNCHAQTDTYRGKNKKTK